MIRHTIQLFAGALAFALWTTGPTFAQDPGTDPINLDPSLPWSERMALSEIYRHQQGTSTTFKDGNVLFDLYDQTKEERYRKALNHVRSQLDGHPRVYLGGFWHKQIYTNQMWLDGLYMGEPFYAQYEMRWGQPENFEDIAHQFIVMSQGWGWALDRFFDDRVTVVNAARGGRSSESFRGEGHWDKARQVKADYVFIQFGHNDNPGKGPGRETSPAPGGDYRANLSRYLKEIREEMGAIPILVTPAARRFFTEDGAIHHPEHEGNRPYAEAVRAVAQQEDVAVVDLNALSEALYLRMGESDSARPQPEGDRTHWSPVGARWIALMVVDDTLPQVPELAPYLRSNDE